MFIISLQYHRPIEEVEQHLTGHITWLQRYYQQDVFVASGRKVPRTGGVILARSIARDELDRILAEDPFNAVATYEVTEFAPTMTAPELATLKSM